TATFTQTGGTHAPASGVDIADPSGSAGTYNLSGGTLSTSSVFGNAGNSTFNFNGGTLQATAANTGFLSALTRSNVRNAGAVFDTNGFNVTVSQVLSHSDLGSLNNTAVVTGGGTGYLAPPIVTVSGGGGYGATATAVVAGGSVTNVILSGGSNYTSTPALTFSGGGGTGAGATALFTPDNSTDGGLAKNGSGTLTLAGASTYTGVTNINAGNLRVDNTAGSATGTGTVLVNSNATVGGTGTIAGPTVVGPNAGAIATLDPGNGAPGRLTFSSSLAITPNARFNVKIGGTTAGTTYDQVRVGGALTLLGNLNVNLTGGFVPSVGQTFYILDDTGTASPTGTFANAPGGIYTDSTGTVYTVTYASHDPADMSNSDLNDVSLTVVPEPASLGLLALGSLCLLARRRRDR
ncbi:MAG TPA: autotransporter-associated beta strand repeat-containing protein, partial [Bryobacteraceae bacterium]